MESKILERIFGEFLFISIAFIFYFLVSKEKDYKKIKKFFIIYIIILTILSYNFKPFCEIDLTNLQYQINTYYNYSWNQLFELMLHTSDFSRLFYFYVIHKLNDVNLLQTFVTTVVYSIIFYTIYDYCKRKEYLSICAARTLFLFMMLGQYIDLISGIRSTTAFALFYFCIYREFIQKKSILSNLLFYIIAIGFHNAVVPAIIIRMLFFVFQREKNTLKKLFNYLISILLIIGSVKYGGIILESTVKKANIYLTGNIYSSTAGYFISFFTFFILLYLLFLFYKNHYRKKLLMPNEKKYFFFALAFVMIVLLFCFEYSVFHRYTILLSMILIPIIITSFDDLSFNYEKIKRLIFTKANFIYYILLFITAFMSFSFGDMKLLQFFIE